MDQQHDSKVVRWFCAAVAIQAVCMVAAAAILADVDKDKTPAWQWAFFILIAGIWAEIASISSTTSRSGPAGSLMAAPNPWYCACGAVGIGERGIHRGDSSRLDAASCLWHHLGRDGVPTAG
jgi:hypothetical protein